MKKGFTLVELLAVIVILAILMVSAGAGVTTVMNNSKMNTFKNEVLTFMNGAETVYSEVSMTPSLYSYIKKSNSGTHGAMCITLAGLVANGAIEKDISTYAGVIILEVPYDGGKIKTTVWVHNSQYGINGIEKQYINRLKFKKNNNTEGFKNKDTVVTASAISGGPIGLVTKLDGIKKMIKNAYGSDTALGRPSGLVDKNITTIDIYSKRGGDENRYNNITCINTKLNIE